MTPQEALAQALDHVDGMRQYGDRITISGPGSADIAAAILDALPEGWAVDNVEESVACETDAYIRGFKDGAQQERERLLRQAADLYRATEKRGYQALAAIIDPEGGDR